MMKKTKKLLVLALVLSLLLTSLVACSKEKIELVVPYKVGGVSDLAVRGVADAVDAADLDVTFEVNNLVGSSGLIGTNYFMKQPADGKTVGFLNCDLLLNYVLGLTEINPDEEMIALACIEQDPYMLMIKADNGKFSTFAEMITYIRENPDEDVIFGDTGSTTVPHLVYEVLKKKLALGDNFKCVNYNDGVPAAMNATLAGECHVFIGAVAPVVGNLEAGTILPIAVSTDTRMASFPDVPTLAESYTELADVNILSWICLAVKAGTPEEDVTRLRTAFQNAVSSETYANTREGLCFEAVTLAPEDIADFITEQLAAYREYTGK